jgi:DnaJ-class molecular chaperone
VAWKDYYRVLGIPRSESPQGIRAAFRDLARRHHPDRAGPGGTPQFREILEAYRILSDAEQRGLHDADLRERERAGAARRAFGAPRRGRFADLDLFAEPGSIRPSPAALLDRLLRGQVEGGSSKGEHAESLLCDVVLSWEEARRGGVLPIRIPVLAPCPFCHGAGHLAGFACPPCDARGALPSEVAVPLEIPPGVPAGTLLELPLEPWGIPDLWLRARIGVRG